MITELSDQTIRNDVFGPSPDDSQELDDEAFARPPLTLAIMETDPSCGLLVVALKGDLDIATLALCRHDLSGALNLFGHGRAKWIILDLSECTYIDSTGLGLFVSLMRTARASGGEAVFACPTPHLQRVFEVTHMMQVLTVTDTVDQAKAGIGKAPITPMED